MSAGAVDWMPVSLGRDLERGTSTGTMVTGHEIVVWRDTAGVAHAWEDRCPHRGMRLSFGFVRGDRIACLYHGWEYDGNGQCRRIPAHPDIEIPNVIRTVRYACAEGSGLVWVSLAERPPPFAPEDLEVVPVRSLHIRCPAAATIHAFEAEGVRVAGEGGLLRLELPMGQALAGLQNVDTARCALHLGLVGRPRPDAARELVFWSEGLRRRLEGTAS